MRMCCLTVLAVAVADKEVGQCKFLKVSSRKKKKKKGHVGVAQVPETAWFLRLCVAPSLAICGEEVRREKVTRTNKRG